MEEGNKWNKNECISGSAASIFILLTVMGTLLTMKHLSTVKKTATGTVLCFSAYIWYILLFI